MECAIADHAHCCFMELIFPTELAYWEKIFGVDSFYYSRKSN